MRAARRSDRQRHMPAIVVFVMPRFSYRVVLGPCLFCEAAGVTKLSEVL